MSESITFLRVIKNGFLNFWRNWLLSVAATMVMTITLIIFAILFLLFSLTNYSISAVKDRVDVSAYFNKGISEEQILTVKSELEQNSQIRSVNYTSAIDALTDFKERHKDDPLVTQSLNELNENPLPATLNIKAFDLETYPQIVESLKTDRYEGIIKKVNFEDSRPIIERLSKALDFIVGFGLTLVIVFSLIAILVVYNTIVLTIYNRREEIEIMRLVGATNWYIRGPFIVEAVLYSLFATVVTGALIFPVFFSLLPKAAVFINPQIGSIGQNISNFWLLTALLLIISSVLAVVSTLLALRKYLKI